MEKMMRMEFIRSTGREKDGSMPFSPLILYGQKEKHQKEKIISLCTVTFWKQTKTETACL